MIDQYDKKFISASVRALAQLLKDHPEVQIGGTYHSSVYDTNFVSPLFWVKYEGDETTDIFGAIEESLHILVDCGRTDDEVREIMGLQRIADNEDDEWTDVDLGWSMPCDVQFPNLKF